MSENQALQVKIVDMPYVPSTLKWVLNDNRIEKIFMEFDEGGVIEMRDIQVHHYLIVYIRSILKVFYYYFKQFSIKNELSTCHHMSSILLYSGRGKPSPDQLLYACHMVGEDPGDTLYVGDMEVDRLCAKRSGCHFVHANWGYGNITTVKDIFFDSIKDLA